jgi:hypothetical protein
MTKSAVFKIGALICIFSCGSLTGCATIVKGTTQKIPIASDPSAAEVTADGQMIGQTPIEITLERKRDHLVSVSKEGFHPKSIAITKSTGGAVWGNLLAGGLIGWGIDATSGAQYNLSPESISLQLEPLVGGEDGTVPGDSKSDFVRKLNDLDMLKEQSKISEEEYSAMRTSLFKEYYPQMDAEIIAAPSQDAPPAKAVKTGSSESVQGQ